MRDPSPLVGFQCRCGHRGVYVRAGVMDLWARPGETIHDVRKRMRCSVCGEREPSGPYPFADSATSHLWICTDKVVSAQFEREAPPEGA